MYTRYALTIRYDGTNYCGWQYQKNGITVQQVLIETLESIIGKLKDGIHGCSRTDSGVHADEYVCHFESETTVPCRNMVLGLNSRLPEDIVVLDCKEVDLEFHSRYDCKSKTYRYYIYPSQFLDPFKRNYEYLYKNKIDIPYLNECCKEYIGHHDFSAFCSVGATVDDKFRTIFDCKMFESDDGRAVFEVTGDGFLYNMVRIMVGTLIYINEGKISKDDLSKMLSGGSRELTGPTAAAHGLHLHKVNY